MDKDWGASIERAAAEKPPVPKDLHYDTWLGPHRSGRTAANGYPANWRRWWNFGNGTLGDMGCHFMDLPFWALDLKHPTQVVRRRPAGESDGCPHWLIVQ